MPDPRMQLAAMMAGQGPLPDFNSGGMPPDHSAGSVPPYYNFPEIGPNYQGGGTPSNLPPPPSNAPGNTWGGETLAGFPSSPFTVIPQPYSNDQFAVPHEAPAPYGGGLPPGWAPPAPPPQIDPSILDAMRKRMGPPPGSIPGRPGNGPTGQPYLPPVLMV